LIHRRKNTRNGPNYDIYIYSKKNSEETLNKRPVQYSFLRKLSDSMDDDNFSQDFQVPVGSLRQKAADLTDKSSEELEDLQTLLHLINLLNKTAKDVSSTEEISSGSEQNISLDDENTAMNYRSSKEDEKCGSRNVESDEYVEVRNKMRSYNPTQSRKCGMVLLLPRRDEKRRRRQVESEINENADQIESKKVNIVLFISYFFRLLYQYYRLRYQCYSSINYPDLVSYSSRNTNLLWLRMKIRVLNIKIQMLIRSTER